MGDDVEVSNLSYENIRTVADGFLDQYHSSRKLPIPIEEIIEFQMGLNVIPIPGMLRCFDIDGFTSNDMSSIYVDEFVYKYRPSRYRFTLAHEVGHLILHKNIFKEAKFGNSLEWKDFIKSIPEKQYSQLEYQAYAFGGLVLVQKEHLQELTEIQVKRAHDGGVALEANWDSAWGYIAEQLAREFDVSTQVIDKRLDKDRIKDAFR